jgi:hypothetical protein
MYGRVIHRCTIINADRAGTVIAITWSRTATFTDTSSKFFQVPFAAGASTFTGFAPLFNITISDPRVKM